MLKAGWIICFTDMVTDLLGLSLSVIYFSQFKMQHQSPLKAWNQKDTTTGPQPFHSVSFCFTLPFTQQEEPPCIPIDLSQSK